MRWSGVSKITIKKFIISKNFLKELFNLLLVININIFVRKLYFLFIFYKKFIKRSHPKYLVDATGQNPVVNKKMCVQNS